MYNEPMQNKPSLWQNPIATKTFTLKLGDTQILITVDETFNTKPSKSEGISTFKTIHYHADYEIFFVSGNNLSITTENSIVEIADSVVIVPPNFNHFSVSKKESSVRFRFSLSKLKNKTPSIYANLVKSIGFDSIVSFPLSNEISVYVAQINRAFHETNDLNSIKIQSLFSLLLISVFELFQPSKRLDQAEYLDDTVNYVPIIEAVLQNHYHENIHLGYLAERQHVSTKQASRILKKNYNSTLAELVNDKKLSISCLFLKNTTLKISEIIEQVGFETESYFYVLFKKKYGISPLAYRKKMNSSDTEI